MREIQLISSYLPSIPEARTSARPAWYIAIIIYNSDHFTLLCLSGGQPGQCCSLCGIWYNHEAQLVHIGANTRFSLPPNEAPADVPQDIQSEDIMMGHEQAFRI